MCRRFYLIHILWKWQKISSSSSISFYPFLAISVKSKGNINLVWRKRTFFFPHNFFFFYRKINVSQWNNPDQCWNDLITQRSYIILLQPDYKGQVPFKGRYDDPLGAAIDYTLETEKRLLKALGNLTTIITHSRPFHYGNQIRLARKLKNFINEKPICCWGRFGYFKALA